jgi:GT2 family glycosyltransferase
VQERQTWVVPRPASLIVTTFQTDSFYTQACLEAIRRWKNAHHELIVVTHDESPLLRAYLDACVDEKLIGRLVFAESRHGHTRGFNLGVQYANADVVFNICNDILIGPSLLDDCAQQLRRDPQLGIIGWHWYNEGTFWRDGKIETFALRDARKPELAPEHLSNIRAAPWFTGKFFEGIGGTKWLQLCNTSFFGIRREVLDRVGGGFSPTYRHYWADDFLSYAVLDQGLDVRHFDRRFRHRDYFHEFQYDQTDVPDRRRHADQVTYSGAFLDSIRALNGGMTTQESVYLHLLAKAIPDGATVTNIGVWKGSSAIVLLDALKSKRISFHFIDCFDLPGVSRMSGQPPVSLEEFFANIQPYIGPQHRVRVVQSNTLEMDQLPRSDFVFVDGGHTRECIASDACLAQSCLTSRGVAAFHDYGCPSWPDVQPVLDDLFPVLEVFQSVAVHRAAPVMREAYHWLPAKPAPR